MSYRELLRVEAQLAQAPIPATPSPEVLRSLAHGLGALLPPPEGMSFQQTFFGNVPVYSGDSDARTVLLHLHGGGFVSGNARDAAGLAGALAQAADTRAMIIDYRLAPEHPHPAAVDDALAVYRALLDDGYDSSEIVISGDSAGAALALCMLVRAGTERLSMPAALTLFSPWVDLSLTEDSASAEASVDPFLSSGVLTACVKHYVGGRSLDDPAVSPLFADLDSFPPMFIQTGTRDILLDDALRLAERAHAAGVDVELRVWPNMFHVWPNFSAVLQEGRQALDAAACFIRRVIASTAN